MSKRSSARLDGSGQTLPDTVCLTTRTKEEWIQRGEQTADIDECHPGWRDQIEALSSMGEEQLLVELGNMQLALATIEDGERMILPSLSFFISYTKFCLAQMQTEVSEGLIGSTSAAYEEKEGVSSQPTKKLKKLDASDCSTITVVPVSGSSFDVEITGQSVKVKDLKKLVAKASGVKRTQQELYEVATPAAGKTVVREDDAVAKMLTDKDEVGAGASVTLVKRELQTFSKHSGNMVLSNDKSRATVISLRYEDKDNMPSGAAMIEECGPGTTVRLKLINNGGVTWGGEEVYQQWINNGAQYYGSVAVVDSDEYYSNSPTTSPLQGLPNVEEKEFTSSFGTHQINGDTPNNTYTPFGHSTYESWWSGDLGFGKPDGMVYGTNPDDVLEITFTGCGKRLEWTKNGKAMPDIAVPQDGPRAITVAGSYGAGQPGATWQIL
jgi:hypothetical protein